MFFFVNSLCVRRGSTQGNLTEGKVSVQLTSLYVLVQISCFRKYKHYLLINKTSYLNEEVNCTEPSPSVRVPCSTFLCVPLILTGRRTARQTMGIGNKIMRQTDMGVAYRWTKLEVNRQKEKQTRGANEREDTDTWTVTQLSICSLRLLFIVK